MQALFSHCFIRGLFIFAERERYLAQFEANNDLNIEFSRLSSTLPREKLKLKNARRSDAKRNPTTSPSHNTAQQFSFESSSSGSSSGAEATYVNLQQSRSLGNVTAQLSPVQTKSSSMEDVERATLREDDFNGNESAFGSTVFALSGIPSPNPRRSNNNINSDVSAATPMTPPSSRRSARATSARSALPVQSQPALATTPPKTSQGRAITSSTTARSHTFRMTGAITGASGSPLRRAGDTGSLRRAFSPVPQMNASPSLPHRDSPSS